MPCKNQIRKLERTSELVERAATKNGETCNGALAHQDYSEWNIDEKCSSQEWKYGEMLEARTGRPVGGQTFTQLTDKSVIDDDDMDSDTTTESNLSLKSQSFLHRVEWSSAQDIGPFFKRCKQDVDNCCMIWGMFMSSTLGASVFMGKNYSENLHSIKKHREQSHFQTDVWHVWKVDNRTMRWDFWSDSK